MSRSAAPAPTGGMKHLRSLTVLFALLVPATAIAAASDFAASCCPGGACCKQGCPLCPR